MATIAAQKTVLNIKLDLDLKKNLQEVAKSLGLPISTIATQLFKTFVTDRSITFEETLVPNARTAKYVEEARADHEKGINISPKFDNAKDAIAWLKS